MKKNIFITSVSFLFTFHLSFAQYKQAEYTIGNGSDECYSMIQTNDGGYAMAGQGGSGGTDLNMLKLDAIGNLQWDKTIGGGTTFSIGNSIVQSKDGGFVATGYCEGYGAGGEDVYVVKLDSNGNLLWTKTIGGPDDDWGNSIIQTTDGGYAITGGTKSYGGGTPNFADIYVIKLNSIGNKLWTKTIEGPWGSDDEGNSIIQTKDGGYALVGDVLDEVGWPDIFVAKLDSIGSLIWTETIGGSDDYGNGYSIVQTVDGGFAMTGYTASFGAGGLYVVKLDSAGSIKSTKVIGGPKGNYGYSIINTNDEGYAVAGATNSFGIDSFSVYIIKLDSLGNLNWTKVYGEPGYNYAYSLIQIKDGGYAVAGNCSSGVYFLKLDSLGNSCMPYYIGGIVDSGGIITTGGIITSSDSGTMGSGGVLSSGGTLTVICESTSIENINPKIESIEVYPNPNNGVFTLSLSNVNGKCNIEIYNVLGEQVLTETLRSTQGDSPIAIGLINLTGQPNGIYFYRVITENGAIIGEGKVIIER